VTTPEALADFQQAVSLLRMMESRRYIAVIKHVLRHPLEIVPPRPATPRRPHGLENGRQAGHTEFDFGPFDH
jgi:hypothetical protein